MTRRSYQELIFQQFLDLRGLVNKFLELVHRPEKAGMTLDPQSLPITSTVWHTAGHWSPLYGLFAQSRVRRLERCGIANRRQGRMLVLGEQPEPRSMGLSIIAIDTGADRFVEAFV